MSMLTLYGSQACGLPVASTFYSGHTEFLKPIRGKFFEIDYQLEKILDAEFKSYWPPTNSDYGSWANPSIDSISKSLQAIMEGYKENVEVAMQASQIIRTHYTWERSADLALKSMHSMGILNFKYDIEG
ncbi:hypothetical protein IEN92_02265 [Polynucleobacter sp. MWH-Creno-3A4]|uniref:hypothetical protein n=1 Tax=Polynucleobacter sp. MWH-Creno-3A4 TaxID=1855886 RepID=UPI001C0D447E|nr:hypothetical protein [Polynucleobacter sp. MWH-Creno-3A4]MBU3605577.1 hypothetical protein [Polynucleobacter sp. MWH-Creno-3A4]